MREKARQARLLAFFNSLSRKDKDLVLKVTETIKKENKDNSRDSAKGNSCCCKTGSKV